MSDPFSTYLATNSTVLACFLNGSLMPLAEATVLDTFVTAWIGDKPDVVPHVLLVLYVCLSSFVTLFCL
jgi:hypothetical protein